MKLYFLPSLLFLFGWLTLTAQVNDKQKEVAKDIIEKEGLVIRPKAKENSKYAYKPLTLSLSEDGQQYVRFIIWHQQWMLSNNLAVPDAKTQITHMVRRSRFLA